QDESGERGAGYAGKVRESILPAVPLPYCGGSGKSLGESVEAGAGHAASKAGGEQPGNVGVCAGQRASEKTYSSHGEPNDHCGLSHQGWSVAANDCEILQPAGADGRKRVNAITQAGNQGHALDRQMTFEHQVGGQPSK